MNKIPIHQNEQGSAILIVLGILTLVLTLALVFLATSRNARTIAMANADNVKAVLLAESAAARAEAIVNYVGTEITSNLPDDSSVSDLEYDFLPYQGVFQADASITDGNDDNHHRLVKVQHFQGKDAGGNRDKERNLYMFYTHDSNNRKGADNRPYPLLIATNYGEYLNFGDSFNKEDYSFNLTYRNILDTSNHVQSRYAFLMLAEGQKFNVNAMAMATLNGNDNYVPSVKKDEDNNVGVLTTNGSDPGVQLNDVKNSTFAIAGYTYNSDGEITGLADGGKYDEKKTVQYGIHPQELRIGDDVIEVAENLKLEDEDCPPQYFNYDNHLSVVKNDSEDAYDALHDFYSLYGLYSGSDDREVVFHGTETDIQDCTDDSPKINLAYLGKPDGTRITWNALSEELKTSASIKTYLTANFEKLFGSALDTDAGGTLFKDDSGNDITDQVFANLVDFCDSDNAISHEATVTNGATPERLEFTTPIDVNSTISIGDACGNEKTPAVIGVGLELTNVARIAANTTSSGLSYWSVTGSGTTSYNLRVVLQNYFNEEIDLPEKVRVIIRGRINPWFAGYYNDAGTNHYQFHGCTHSVDLPSGYATLHATPSTFNFSVDSKPFVIDKTFTPTGPPLGARKVDDTTIYDDTGTFELYLATASNVPGKLERAGIWLQVTDVLVMTADNDVDEPLLDIAYADGANHTILWTKNAVRIEMPWASFRPIAWLVAQDPRCNHKNWQWYDELEDNAIRNVSGFPKAVYNWTADNTVGISTSAGFGMQDKLRKAALSNIQRICVNGTITVDKDLEPGLNFAGLSGDQTPNTFSTAFIPNHPITSLWQLGAVFRGVPGQTINLKKYGGPKGGQKYADGDAWLLDYFKLHELSPNQPLPGKFNPNCFNALSFRYLLANIPMNPDYGEVEVYQPGRLEQEAISVKRNEFFPLWFGTADPDVVLEGKLFKFANDLNFETVTYNNNGIVRPINDNKNDDVLAPAQAKKQSWSPVEAFYNFVKLENQPKYYDKDAAATKDANDRMAESLIGCTAGLLSTRYEYFTVFAIGQSVKYIDGLPAGFNLNNAANADFKKQLVNPVQINTGIATEWYSILATQMRLMTIERDCWFNTMRVVRTQLY